MPSGDYAFKSTDYLLPASKSDWVINAGPRWVWNNLPKHTLSQTDQQNEMAMSWVGVEDYKLWTARAPHNKANLYIVITLCLDH